MPQLSHVRKAPANSPISRENDNMQYGLGGFYCRQVDKESWKATDIWKGNECKLYESQQQKIKCTSLSHPGNAFAIFQQRF